MSKLTFFEQCIIKLITKVMDSERHNQTKAAKRLGITRTTLRRYLRMGRYTFPRKRAEKQEEKKNEILQSKAI